MRRAVVSAVAACSLVAALALAGQAGASTLQAKVVGGVDAGSQDVPWQVLVLPGGYLCGGSVLDAMHVVTAAHCVEDPGTGSLFAPADIDVFAGITDIAARFDGQHPAVTKIDVDPRYDANTYQDDAAILTLAPPGFDLSTSTPKAIALPAVGSGVSPTTDLMVSGWGTTSPRSPNAGDNTDPISQLLQKATLRTSTQCAGAYGATYDPTLELCAGQTGTDACQGDSGGPLAAQVGGVWTLVGLVSSGAGCAWSGYPGLYTRVAATSVHDFLATELDLPVNESAPTLTGSAVPGGTVTCAPGTWANANSFTFTILRGDGTVLAHGPTATLSASDAGTTIRCSVVGSDGTDAATAMSDAVTIAAPPAPAPPPAATVPAPTTTAPTTTTATVATVDRAAPTAVITRVRCSRRRVCVLDLRVSDPAPSAGLRTPEVLVRTTYRTTCRAHGRRVACTRTSTRRLVPHRTGTATYRVTTPRLRAGTQRFEAVALDRAGHRQARAATATRGLR